MFESASTQSLVLAGASLAGAAFIGYCIYFDSKRRSDPLYKQKIRERRRLARQGGGGGRSGGGAPIRIPTDPSEWQAFFMQEVQIGEELLQEGNIDLGTDHLANAVALCGQPRQLLQVFQQTLPEPVFVSLIQKLPEVQKRLQAGLAASRAAPMSGGGEGDDSSPHSFEQVQVMEDPDDLE